MTTRKLVGWTAIVAPLLHTATDVLEWTQGGFSRAQLWLNYAAFLPVPALMLGLYAMQRPRIGRAGLWGALIYGGAFVYFAHTTLWALAESAPDYATLWGRLGIAYTAHGVAMVVGGLLFGWATWKAGVVPRLAPGLFIAGLAGNLVLGLLPLPDILQTIASGVRNAGFVSLGWYVARAEESLDVTIDPTRS